MLLYLKNVGLYTEIDDVDYNLVKKYSWRGVKEHRHTYHVVASILIEGRWKTRYLHQLICPVPKGFVVDHIDRNGLNNKKSNLRKATYSQNNVNSKPSSATGVKGVYLYTGKKKLKKPYEAQIRFCKKIIRIGSFSTLNEAKMAHQNAFRKLHGVYAPNYMKDYPLKVPIG